MRRGGGGAWLGTAVCVGLLLLVVGLDRNFRASPRVVDLVPNAAGEVGEILPDFTLPDLEGRPVRLSDFRGRRVVLTFERSVDW